MPFSGLTLLHFDSHPDLLLPKELQAKDVFNKVDLFRYVYKYQYMLLHTVSSVHCIYICIYYLSLWLKTCHFVPIMDTRRKSLFWQNTSRQCYLLNSVQKHTKGRSVIKHITLWDIIDYKNIIGWWRGLTTVWIIEHSIRLP